MSSSVLVSPDTDLCQLPSGPVPPGKSVDFTQTDLQAVANGVTIPLTIIATLFVKDRLCANFRKLHGSDFMILVALGANITTQVSFSLYSRFFRRVWHFPLCWTTDQYRKVNGIPYLYELVNLLT
ncbi:hypothetical protein GGR57DRAFT_498307 [Xylariaceae sp. FL1272]|nr:hypothetical protein GGR57DRAFT_498307 [Xylariaceae sp. FL1272]